MICKNVVVSAPINRRHFSLRRIQTNENTCVYEEKDGYAILAIGLCNKLPGTEKHVMRALQGGVWDFQAAYMTMSEPHIDRYVLEDSQVILHIWQEGKPEFSMLLQDQSIEFEDKNWREPFLPYWEG